MATALNNLPQLKILSLRFEGLGSRGANEAKHKSVDLRNWTNRFAAHIRCPSLRTLEVHDYMLGLDTFVQLLYGIETVESIRILGCGVSTNSLFSYLMALQNLPRLRFFQLAVGFKFDRDDVLGGCSKKFGPYVDGIVVKIKWSNNECSTRHWEDEVH